MSTRMQVLYLEDDQSDVMLVKRALDRHFPGIVLKHARSRDEYLEFLESEAFDVLLSDHSIPGCEDMKAFHIANGRRPGVPFIYLSGFDDPLRDIRGLKAIGVDEFVSKSQLDKLSPAIEKALAARQAAAPDAALTAGYEKLLNVITELSRARDLPEVMAIVRRAARALTGADSASFVLREGDFCRFADEEGVGPLWKGQRFPVQSCLSGWTMLNRQPSVVEDVQRDPRVPAEAYDPAFVRSVVMVPIRSAEPIGVIGTYWARKHAPETREIRLLQALADTTAVTMENIRLRQELESRVKDRTAELEAFSYAVAHDLRAPLRHVKAFSGFLLADHGENLDEGMRYNLHRISTAASRMTDMIEGLLQLSIMARTPVDRRTFDLAQLARELVEDLNGTAALRVEFAAPPAIPVSADPALLRLALQNLLANAWKFTGKVRAPAVELGVEFGSDGSRNYFVRDNGAGFDEALASRLFGVFQRLHMQAEFPGTGIGLATVHRIVQKHDGRIWASGKPGSGAIFRFTLGNDAPQV